MWRERRTGKCRGRRTRGTEKGRRKGERVGKVNHKNAKEGRNRRREGHVK